MSHRKIDVTEGAPPRGPVDRPFVDAGAVVGGIVPGDASPIGGDPAPGSGLLPANDGRGADAAQDAFAEGAPAWGVPDCATRGAADAPEQERRAETPHGVPPRADAATAGFLVPREDGQKESGRSPEARFLGLMAEIVAETPASRPFPGGKIGAAFAARHGDALARLIILSRKLSGAETPAGVHHQALLAASLFRASRDNPAAVAAVLDDIDLFTSRNSPIYIVMRGLVWSVSLFCCAALLLYGVSAAAHAGYAGMPLRQALTAPYWDILRSPLFIAAAFGLLGSVVSILLRLKEFEGATRRSRHFLKTTGVVLPLVGATFACVTCALFASGIVNFQFATPGAAAAKITDLNFFIVVGFLSGFSERFTRGLLGSAEGALSSGARFQAGTITTREGSATVFSEVKRTDSAGGRQL